MMVKSHMGAMEVVWDTKLTFKKDVSPPYALNLEPDWLNLIFPVWDLVLKTIIIHFPKTANIYLDA